MVASSSIRPCTTWYRSPFSPNAAALRCASWAAVGCGSKAMQALVAAMEGGSAC